MNKIITGIGVVGLIALVWYVFDGSRIDYVATVDDEVSKLEMELTETKASLSAGTLTAEEVIEVQKKVITRLETIDSYAAASQKVEMSNAQRVMLMQGLDKLKDVGVKYQTTLVAVDSAVLEIVEVDSGGSNKALLETLASTIEKIEEYIVVEKVQESESDMVTVDESASSSEETTYSSEGDNGQNVVSDDIEPDGFNTEIGSSTREIEASATSTFVQ